MMPFEENSSGGELDTEHGHDTSATIGSSYSVSSPEEGPTTVNGVVSTRPQARSSHATHNVDGAPSHAHWFIDDDVASSLSDGGAKEQSTYLVRPSAVNSASPSAVSVFSIPPTSYRRNTCFLVPDNALQLRLSMSSTDSEHDPSTDAGGPVAEEAHTSRSPSRSASVSKADSTRAPSTDSAPARRHDGDARAPSGGRTTDRPALSRGRVRFRSRVRIASGTQHSTHECTDDCSPSSSISAPLRESTDDADACATAAWPLPGGSSLSKSEPVAFVDDMFGFDGAGASCTLSSSSKKRPRPSPHQKRARRPTSVFYPNGPGSTPADERTPLTSSLHTHSQPRRTSSNGHAARARHRAFLSDIADSDEDLEALGSEEARARRHSLERAARRRDEELAFGRWPWRLVNGYWWWWKCEPVFCCCYASDSDSDDLS